jgi:hypothetical protein
MARQPNKDPTKINDIVSLLSRPPPAAVTVSRINLGKDIKDYEHSYAVVLDNLFSVSECSALVTVAEATASVKGWQPALIQGESGPELALDLRDCGRIIVDNQAIADAVLTRLRDLVPELEILQNWHEVTGWSKWDMGKTFILSRYNLPQLVICPFLLIEDFK